MQLSGEFTGMDFNLVIPVFDRLHSIERLMKSIERMEIRGTLNVVISCDGGASAEVRRFAEGFSWERGSYRVIQRDENLGVDDHNLECMRMAIELGHVVVLEDDLVVSPTLQAFLLQAYAALRTEKDVAGISMYRYPLNEANRFPFELIPNDEFLYYQQRPSSKGCFYTREMVESYFDFLDRFDHDYTRYHLPDNVLKWDDKVWEKSFYAYLVQNNRYVAFPRYSLTTDFADHGVHMKKQIHRYQHQTPLYLADQFSAMRAIVDTENVYDAFYEIDVDVIKRYLPQLVSFDLAIDLYGNKDLSKVKETWVLSEKDCTQPNMGWDRKVKPEVMNLLMNQKGSFYHLAEKHRFRNKPPRKKLKENFMYYYPDTRLIDLVRMKLSEVVSRFT